MTHSFRNTFPKKNVSILYSGIFLVFTLDAAISVSRVSIIWITLTLNYIANYIQILLYLYLINRKKKIMNNLPNFWVLIQSKSIYWNVCYCMESSNNEQKVKNSKARSFLREQNKIWKLAWTFILNLYSPYSWAQC